jgi:hypothetical protein
VKITTYYDHPDSFLTLALVSKPDIVYGLHLSLRPYLISLWVESALLAKMSFARACSYKPNGLGDHCGKQISGTPL